MHTCHDSTIYDHGRHMRRVPTEFFLYEKEEIYEERKECSVSFDENWVYCLLD
jgi:hypothetical protein